MSVAIYRLTRQFTTYAWLCDEHVALLTRPEPADGSRIFIGDCGWTAERLRDVDGGCGRCEGERQRRASRGR